LAATANQTMRNKRETVSKLVQFLAACAVITIALRLTYCSYGDSNRQATAARNSRIAANESTSTLHEREPPVGERPAKIEQKEVDTQPTCKIKINLEDIFPKQTKIWIQIGTWLNPITPPPDVGMIGFEPEMATVSQLIPKRPENVYFVPAAVSNQGGIAVFGSGINSGQSSSLNVSANSRLRARRF
jgi:hypothetical protein